MELFTLFFFFLNKYRMNTEKPSIYLFKHFLSCCFLVVEY